MEFSTSTGSKCRCYTEFGLTSNKTYDELVEQHYKPQRYCTAGRWVCSNLDRELRHATVDRDRRKQYERRLKDSGMTQEQIDQREQRKRRRTREIRAYDAPRLEF